jgi:hypothetical protein
MRHRRHSRRNAWFGNSIGHRKAAFRGYRSWLGKHSRRTRRNRGSTSIRGIVGKSKAQITKGVRVLPTAGAILLGNVGATWGVEQLAKHLPILRTNKYAEVISLFGLGIVEGMLSKHIPVGIIKRSSNAFYVGGMLAGVTRSLKYIFPGTFSTCGIGDDMDGMGDWFASAGPQGNVAMAFPNTHGWRPPHHGPYPHPRLPFHPHMHGMGAYVGPSTPDFQMHGMGDYAQFGATMPSAMVRQGGMNPAVHTHMGDAMGEVMNEIAGMA